MVYGFHSCRKLLTNYRVLKGVLDEIKLGCEILDTLSDLCYPTTNLECHDEVVNLIHDPLDCLTYEVDRWQKQLQYLSAKVQLGEPLVKPEDCLSEDFGDLENTRVDAGERREQGLYDMRGYREDDLRYLSDDCSKDMEDGE